MKTTLAIATLVVAVSLGGLMSAPVPAESAPLLARPSIVPMTWELEFEYDRPRTIQVERADGTIDWYVYVTYKVTNHTGRDQVFVPEMIMATELGHIRRAGEDVPMRAIERIKRHVSNPLLENPYHVVGLIFEGEEHARESVAIWPMPDQEATRLRLFFGGLSGETQRVLDPATGEQVLTNKVKMVTYRMPGKPRTPHRRPFEKLEERWVMR